MIKRHTASTRDDAPIRALSAARGLLKAQGGFFRSLRRARASLQNSVLGSHGYRLVRFCMVGSLGVLINTALLYLLTEAGGLNHLIAAIFATEAAILNNFLLNDRWTFSDVEPGMPGHQRALRYHTVALVGLVASVATLAGLTYLLSMHYLIANLFAIGVGTLWNYTASSCFAWTTLKNDTPTVGLLAGAHGRCRCLVSSVVAEVVKLWAP